MNNKEKECYTRRVLSDTKSALLSRISSLKDEVVELERQYDRFNDFAAQDIEDKEYSFLVSHCVTSLNHLVKQNSTTNNINMLVDANVILEVIKD